MIVTYEWLNEWLDIKDKSVEEVCESLNSIGLEVESLVKQQVPKNVVVGKVLECKKHPDANKLSVCQVDVGDEVLQIVCGAKNVAKDQYVAVAKIGAVLDKDFKIKKAKLRGVESYGMICSSNEIGLVKTNDGIMELDESIGELILGKELSEYPLLNDSIIHIELTANRGDCLSVHGVARDLSAYYKKELKTKEYNFDLDRRGIGRVLELDSDSGIRSALKYMFFEKEDLKCDFLTLFRLYMCEEEIKTPVQNAITYATLNSGVVLRAYDFDKFKKDENQKAVLSLKKCDDGIDRIYNEEDLVSEVGLNQSKKFSVDENSKNIIVEASFVDAEYISLKQYETKAKTDELFYRSSRGSESDLEFGLKEVGEVVKNKAKIYNGFEETINDFEEKIIQVNSSFIDEFVGNPIESVDVISTLQRLGFDVDFRGEFYVVKVPLFRSDIKNEQDIIEEIVRIYGIDNIEAKPLCFAEKPVLNQTYETIKKRRFYKTKAVGCGYFEVISYLYDNKEELKELGFSVLDDKVDLKNPITNELNTLRPTLCLNLLRMASHNVKVGRKKVKLFEIARVITKDLSEVEKFAFVYSGLKEEDGFKADLKEVSFKDVVDDLFAIIPDVVLKNATPKEKLFNPYEYAKIYLDSKEIGFLARVHLEVEKKYDLKRTYLLEVDFDSLKYGIKRAKEYSKFQNSIKDLSFVAKKDLEYEKVKEVLEENIDNIVKNFYCIDEFLFDQNSDNNLKDKKSITIRFVLQDLNKTLDDETIKKTLDEVIKILEQKLGLELR